MAERACSARMLPALTLLSLCAAAEPAPVSVSGDIDLLDERAWVESVSRRRQSQASAPAPVEVVLIEDLLKSPASTIPDRLRYLPGVDVYQMRHGQYEVGMRGYNGTLNNRILVLYDGWRFNLDTSGSPIWTGTIDYSDLERVEVAKGPGSVTYGDNAFGGVVSLTSKPVGDTVRFIALGRVGLPSAAEGDATLSGPMGHGFYGKLGAGILRLSDLPAVSGGVPQVPSSRTGEQSELDTGAWRARALLGYHINADWSAEVQAKRLERDYWQVVDGMTYGTPIIPDRDDQLTAELRGPWLRVAHSERHAQPGFINLKTTYDPTSDFLYNQYAFDNHERVTRVQAEVNAAGHSLGVGAERSTWVSESNLWRKDALYTDRSTWAEVETANNAIFAEDQWRAALGWQVTGGLRLDHDDLVGIHASPRLAVNWAPDDRRYALLALSSGYRLPSPLERFENDHFLKPSEDLKAETIQSVETQYRWREQGSEVSVGGFFNRSNNLIWRLPLPLAEQQANFNSWAGNGFDPVQGPGPMFQFANLDNPVTVCGAELGGRKAIERTPFTLWGNGTWTHYRTRDPVVFRSAGFSSPIGPVYQYDFTLPRDANAPPEWKGSLGVDIEAGPWFGTAAGRAASGRYVYDQGHTRLFQNAFPAVQQLDPYVVCDLSLGYRFGGANFVRLSCLDVFDSGHVEFYRPTQASLQAGNEDQLTSDLGRMLSLAVGVDF